MAVLPENTDSLLITNMPNIRYLTGFTGSSGCAIVTRRHKFFFTDFRYRDQASKEVKSYKVCIVKGPAVNGFCDYVRAKHIKLGTLGLDYAKLSHEQFLLIRKSLKGVKLKDAGGWVEKQRRVKSRAEIGRIRKASRIADKALGRFRRCKVAGRTEKEVAWMLESFMREAGSGPIPFEIIVASGPRSAMPHGVASDRKIRKNELVVIDMGASVDGYCCDITRTFSTGRLSPVQERIYRVVGEAQEHALEAAAAGKECALIDKIARDHIDASGFGDSFGHSLGHGVGLEAHEAPALSQMSKGKLAAGMTVTIEPGIYLPRAGGVRIEDTVLIGKRGASSLTGFTRELIKLK